MKFNTKVIHAGVHPDPATGAIMTPIYQTSTYVQEEIGIHKGFEYSRTGNPTRAILENNLSAIEGGKFGACFGSGLAAIDAVIKMLNPGDEVISTNDLYGGSYRIFTTIFEKYGINFHFVNMMDVNNIQEKINSNTKLIWIETPTNPMMNIIDVRKVCKIAKESKIVVAVDNTFATPYLQRPLELGADIVMHSVTKYLGGHSDLIAGAMVIGKDDLNLIARMENIHNSLGPISGAFDSYLLLRSLKTLVVRMQRHNENAMKLAQYFEGHNKISRVIYPGLASHPQHNLAKSQMEGFSGIVSLELNGNLSTAKELLEKSSIFTLAESLGGVESLIEHPGLMTHASLPKERREKLGISDTLIRLSVGLENIDDLIDDIESSLN